jgi:hypothetical protein
MVWFTDKTDVEEKVAAQELEEPENTETVLVSELPVDYQIYRLIDDCGAEGLTQTVRHLLFFLSLLRLDWFNPDHPAEGELHAPLPLD